MRMGVGSPALPHTCTATVVHVLCHWCWYRMCVIYCYRCWCCAGLVQYLVHSSYVLQVIYLYYYPCSNWYPYAQYMRIALLYTIINNNTHLRTQMISRLYQHVGHSMAHQHIWPTPSLSHSRTGVVNAIKYMMANRKSQEQLSYFASRATAYDQHKYPHYVPTITLHQFVAKYQPLKIQATHTHTQHQQHELHKSTQSISNQEGKHTHPQMAEQVVGRISAIRKHGKTTFIDIRQQHLRLQVTIKTDKQLQFKRGDVVGVKGVPFVTKKGQLSINCATIADLALLAPCMWMLPEYDTLKDPQARFRNKPLDLITNNHSLQIIKKRAKAICTLRNQLQAQGYVQVETPILSSSCGGAIAKPFVTYHNDHKADLYLRIAPQLYLKKLLVGGLLKVFEIGKNFRNQSIDQTHNPQFTSCELYCAYEDYRGMMSFTHRLINKIAKEVNGSSIIKGKNSMGEPVDIDLSKPWKEVDFMVGLEQALGMKLPIDFNNPETISFYDGLCKKNQIPCQQPRSIERLLDKLAGRYLETTHEPFMIINHPKVMSPLAKPLPNAPHLTQRFELFINRWEIVNSYTELNDPRIQKENTPTDLDFVEALQYGLMPCAGWGIGLDRFIMLLTQSQRIQQVIVFPLLREMFQNTEQEKEVKKSQK